MSGTITPYDKALPEVPGRNTYTKPTVYLRKLGEGNYKVQTGLVPLENRNTPKIHHKSAEFLRSPSLQTILQKGLLQLKYP